ncbi:Helix-turn-helix domain-containing protein [Belliella buryatensis]|uniref:Helix-turn-helix domain-containing protein n=1 Tax=Belliella buryatensis TaxID=1500549 RepID=A0A239H612_9BACT|nr:helix-turn-helix domain-containing protein [Belliella buryatensis]SNS76810.1 Helix-turn-helix domain-containing protein [Belliella buryatensis]
MELEEQEDVIFKLNIALDFKQVYKDPDLSLTKLAALLGVHYGNLSKIIKNKYGVGFRKFLNEIRIKKLLDKIQLEATQPNVEQCMEISGFKSRVTFFNAFRSQTGTSLSGYYKKDFQSKNSKVIIFDSVDQEGK